MWFVGVPVKSLTGPRLLLDSTALHALLDAGLHLILKLNCTRCRGRVSVVPKLAWVSPARPRLPSDSKHVLRGEDEGDGVSAVASVPDKPYVFSLDFRR